MTCWTSWTTLKQSVVHEQVPVSSVSPQERLLVRDVPNYPGVVQCIARYGYQDKVSQDGAFLTALLKEVSHLLSIL